MVVKLGAYVFLKEERAVGKGDRAEDGVVIVRLTQAETLAGRASRGWLPALTFTETLLSRALSSSCRDRAQSAEVPPSTCCPHLSPSVSVPHGTGLLVTSMSLQ